MSKPSKVVGSGNYERKLSAEVLCKDCGATKLRTKEFFVLMPSGALRYGHCIACHPAATHRYYLANRNRLIAKSAARYDAKREEILEQQKKKRPFIDLTKKNAAARTAKAVRRKTDPMFRLNSAISCNMRGSLNKTKNGCKWEALVGYTLVDLRIHLERQFVRGMRWDIYGAKWHVDHIQPLASFSFSSPEDDEFRACWAKTNLRPLWKALNLSKGAKREVLL